MDENTTIFNARYYIEATPFTSEQQGKYGLKSIRVEPYKEGALILATNGHILAAFYDVFATCKEPITLKHSEEIIELLRVPEWEDSDTVRCVSASETDIEILEVIGSGPHWQRPSTLIAVVPAQVTAEAFPNWQVVMPARKDVDAAVALWFNAYYLKACGDISNKWKTICVRGTGSEAQAIVRADREDFFAVLMPVREDKSAVPEAMLDILKTV